MTRFVYDATAKKIKKVEDTWPIQILDSYSQTPSTSVYLAELDFSKKPPKVIFYRLIGKRKSDGVFLVSKDKTLLQDVNENFFAQFKLLLQKSDLYPPSEKTSNINQEKDVDYSSSKQLDTHLYEKTQDLPKEATPIDDANKQELDSKKNSTNKGFWWKIFSKKPKNVSTIVFYGDSDDVETAITRINKTIPDGEKIEKFEFVTLSSLRAFIQDKVNYLLIVDKTKISLTQSGLDFINILEQGGVTIAEIKSVITMSDADLVSLIQNVQDVSVQHILYNQQRVFLFVNETGGVGKTTLCINLGNWLASNAANVMYLEVLGGSGIDNLIKSKSAKIDDIFDGLDEPHPVPYESGKIAYVSLEDSSKGSISQSSNWSLFWDRFINLEKKPEVQYHAVLIDTYMHIISTRYLFYYATDVFVVTDMRETTENMTKNTIELLMQTYQQFQKQENHVDKNFYVVINAYRDNLPIAKERYQKIIAETKAITENYGVKLKYITIPWMPDYYQQIIIPDKDARNLLIQDLVREIYGVKV